MGRRIKSRERSQIFLPSNLIPFGPLLRSLDSCPLTTPPSVVSLFLFEINCTNKQRVRSFERKNNENLAITEETGQIERCKIPVRKDGRWAAGWSFTATGMVYRFTRGIYSRNGVFTGEIHGQVDLSVRDKSSRPRRKVGWPWVTGDEKDFDKL